MPNKRLVKVETKRVEDRMTPARWGSFIGYIQSGMSLGDALDKVNFPRKEYDKLLVLDSEKREQVDIARSEHYRRLWPDELVNTIATELVEREDVPLRVIIDEYAPPELKGRNAQSSFNNMLLADPIAAERIERARRTQMEQMADDIIAIAKDDSRDILVEKRKTRDGIQKIYKSNPSAVRRSEIEIKAKQWLMTKIHHKKFGERKQQDINVTIKDHAEELAEARKRRIEGKSHYEQEIEVTPNYDPSVVSEQ